MKFTVEDRRCRTSPPSGSNCSTIPNLPLGGPGRSIKGTGALTEFEVEAAPADDPSKLTKVKLVEATADVNPPETPLEPIFDDKSGKKRVTGPVEFAIDGKDETAWGIDAGPGRRNVSRARRSSSPRSRSSIPSGTMLTFYLKQNHGGWNSDDNQNNNLGRFRLSVTTAPDAEADPLPQRVREILAIPREQRTPAQTRRRLQLLADDGARVEGGRTTRSRRSGSEHPEGATQLVAAERATRPRETHILKRGDFLKPGRAGRARRARRSCTRCPPDAPPTG